VADVFDALTHDRLYKLAWSVDDAIAEIARLSEEQFDPRVVEAFLKVIGRQAGNAGLRQAA
jgi:putative two-component system response regulator